MTVSTIDQLRGEVDRLRAGREAGAVSLTEASAVLAAGAVREGASDAPRHEGGVVHACPWHTCQATRHN